MKHHEHEHPKCADGTPVPQPDHEAIAVEAYYIWLAEGAQQNSPDTFDNWMEAQVALEGEWASKHQHSEPQETTL